MTYYFETPDDPKDTWHWMGIAVSVAQSIGLNHDSSKSNLDPQRRRQWKRIWWSCVIRDRLIAIGMRRPLRIKEEDYDVPLPCLEDFDLKPLPADLSSLPSGCEVATDSSTRHALATMFVEKAKLCSCISSVLSQYAAPQQSVSEEGTARIAGALAPRNDLNHADVKSCHNKLLGWHENLAPIAKLCSSRTDSQSSEAGPIVVHRSLLHLIYYMTLSTLHRNPLHPTATFSMPLGLELSARDLARFSASRITDIAHTLLEQDYQRFLPTTGITVLQPALICHLLDIKSTDQATSVEGLREFCRCIEVLSRLRDVYAAADFTMKLISAAVRRADIDMSGLQPLTGDHAKVPLPGSDRRKASSVEDLVEMGLRHRLVTPMASPSIDTHPNPPMTPPSDGSQPPRFVDTEKPSEYAGSPETFRNDAIEKRVEQYLAPRTISIGSNSQMQNETLAASSFFAGIPSKHPSISFAQANIANTDFGDNNLKSTLEGNTGTMFRGSTPMLQHDLDREFESLFNVEDMTDSALAVGSNGPGTFNSMTGGVDSINGGSTLFSGGMQGESSGFFWDVDWKRDVNGFGSVQDATMEGTAVDIED